MKESWALKQQCIRAQVPCAIVNVATLHANKGTPRTTQALDKGRPSEVFLLAHDMLSVTLVGPCNITNGEGI